MSKYARSDWLFNRYNLYSSEMFLRMLKLELRLKYWNGSCNNFDGFCVIIATNFINTKLLDTICILSDLRMFIVIHIHRYTGTILREAKTVGLLWWLTTWRHRITFVNSATSIDVNNILLLWFLVHESVKVSSTLCS